MARKFLYIIAVLIVLVIAALFALRFWAEDLTKFAFVPTVEFTPQPALEANVYESPAMWISRPGLPLDKNPAYWLPPALVEDVTAKEAQILLMITAQGRKVSEISPAEMQVLRDQAGLAPLPAAVFFVHPTSYLEKAQWNAPLDDAESRDRAELFVRGMASPFNKSQDLWAPRYRQATVGAFLTDAPEAGQAVDLAYRDVLQAFDYFVETVGKDTPIVLAGHSQGAFHLRRLIQERVAGKPLAARIAAAYVIGWPVSLVHDLPLMRLPACTTADQPGCVMSWASFAEPADNAMLLEGFATRPGLDGQAMGTTPFLCTNPLTGTAGGTADAAANLGTLVPDVAARTGSLVKAMVPARCGDDGFLYIGTAPEMGAYVLPGNNYHLYDIPLFWANLRADAARRVQAWKPRR